MKFRKSALITAFSLTLVFGSCESPAVPISESNEEIEALRLLGENELIEVSVHRPSGEEMTEMIPKPLINNLFAEENLSYLANDRKLLSNGGVKVSDKRREIWIGEFSGNIHNVGDAYFEFRKVPPELREFFGPGWVDWK